MIEQRKRESVSIQNAEGTAEQKPDTGSSNGDWIDFWKQVTGEQTPASCNVSDCKYKKNKGLSIDGAHVIISEVGDSKAIESLLQRYMKLANKDSETMSASEKNVSMNNRMNSNIFLYNNLKIQIRKDMIKEARACDGNRKPLFITPICHQCNVSDMDEFKLKKGSILVPLYECDIKHHF